MIIAFHALREVRWSRHGLRPLTDAHSAELATLGYSSLSLTTCAFSATSIDTGTTGILLPLFIFMLLNRRFLEMSISRPFAKISSPKYQFA